MDQKKYTINHKKITAMKQEQETYIPPRCVVVSLISNGILLSSGDDVTGMDINDTWVWD